MTTTCEQQLLNDRYRIGPLLSSDDVAEVYQGLDLWLGRAVAVKVFRPDPDDAALQRFAVEARSLARLNHPSLVTVFDAGMTDQRPYLVMQLLEGQTLGERISQGPMSPEEVAELGQRLAEILSHVHCRGVVHRDVKPAAFLFDGDEQLHLTGFGICRLVDATEFSHLDPLIGNAAYLAPEQLCGYTAGPAADVYALGLVLVECLTGYRDYGGTVAQAVTERRRRPPRIPTGLPPALSQVLQAMTVDVPEHRPDAAICAHRLRLAEPACTAPPLDLSPPQHRPRPLTRLRSPLTVAAGTAAAIVLLAAPTGSHSVPKPLPPTAQTAPQVAPPPPTQVTQTTNSVEPIRAAMPIPQAVHAPSPAPSSTPSSTQPPPATAPTHQHKPHQHKKTH